MSVVAIWWVQQGNWVGGLYFDEQWRANFVMSERPWERMLLHNTPNPIGWVYLMKVLSLPFGYQPLAFRLINVGIYLVAALVISLLTMRVLERVPRLGGGRWAAPIGIGTARLVGATAAGLLAFSALVSRYYHYFNNYPTEVLWVALMLLFLHERRAVRTAEPLFALLVVLSPLMMVGGALTLPPILGCWLVAVWRERARVGAAPRSFGASLWWLFGSSAAGLLVAAVNYKLLYGPIGSKPSITQWWINDFSAVGGGNELSALVGKAGSQFFQGMAGPRVLAAGGALWVVAKVAIVAAFGAGIWQLGRRWLPMVVVPFVAYAVAVSASYLVGWPITLERVNLAFTFLIFLAVDVGVVYTIVWCCRGSVRAVVLVIPLLLIVIWPDPWVFWPEVFSRHAVDDMAMVAESPAKRNVVFVYHPLAHWYAHDALINIPRGDRQFELEWESEEDPDRLVDDGFDRAVLAKGVKPGDRVWCLLSFHSGLRNERACNTALPNLELVVEERRRATVVRGFDVRPDAAPDAADGAAGKTVPGTVPPDPPPGN